MDHSIFSELSYVIAIAAGVSLIMRLLKQPLIIGHILTGIIVGPSVLDIVHSEETFEAFSALGIALLLFIIGLGLNPRVIKELGKVSAIAGGGQVIITTIAGTLIAMSGIIGLEFKEAALVGIGLAFSSTIIILKLISDKKELTRLYGKLAIGVLLVQDIIATIALLVLAASSEGGVSAGDFLVLAGKGVAIGAVLFLFSSKILPHLQKLVAGSQEFLFLFALGWGFGVSSLFEKSGFSLEVGALFAGVALASLPYAQEISARLRPLRDFFIVLFFIALGAGIGVETLSDQIIPAIILSALVIIVNPIAVMTLLGFMGYTKRTSFKTGITMAQISEFSLIFLILAERDGYVSEDVISMMTLVALITIAVSSYMIIYMDNIYAWLEDRFKLFEHKKLGYEQHSRGKHDVMIFGYQRGGQEFVKLFQSMKKKFVVVDYNPDVIDELEGAKADYIYGDATDIELLDELGMEKTKLVVSTVTEHETNKFIVTQAIARNPKVVVIAHAETEEDAQELYSHGASYVLLPHYIGSEKIGSFIKRNGFKRSEFNKYKEKHIKQLDKVIFSREDSSS